VEDEISKKQLKQLGEALKTMATDSAVQDVKQSLEGLKEDRKELLEVMHFGSFATALQCCAKF
jgi:hypothetical protein